MAVMEIYGDFVEYVWVHVCVLHVSKKKQKLEFAIAIKIMSFYPLRPTVAIWIRL